MISTVQKTADSRPWLRAGRLWYDLFNCADHRLNKPHVALSTTYNALPLLQYTMVVLEGLSRKQNG